MKLCRKCKNWKAKAHKSANKISYGKCEAKDEKGNILGVLRQGDEPCSFESKFEPLSKKALKKQASKPKVIQCEYCEKTYKTQDGYDNHLDLKHGDEK